ncbi:MAG: DUF4118 domain-containing protein [Bradymonadaceae bacterium]
MSPSEHPTPNSAFDSSPRSVPYRQWFAALGVVGVSTGIGLGIREWVAEADLVMVFLLGVMFVAYRMQRLPALLSAVVSVAAFDVFFVHPYYTLTVNNLNHVLTFAVMAVVGLTISGLTARVKGEAEAARRREQSTAALYRFAQRLALATSPDELLETAGEHLQELFDTSIVVYRKRDPDSPLRAVTRLGAPPDLETEHRAVQRAYDTGEPAGVSTSTASGAEGFYTPIEGVSDRVGVLGVIPDHPHEFADPERRNLLDAHADQIGLFFERLRLSEEARQTQLALETERVRNAVLSSVSHDLRTPLSSIMGASSTLIDTDHNLAPSDRRRLAETVYEQSRRLDRLLENLLKMTQIEGESLEVDAEWHIPAEIIGSALSHLEPELANRDVTVTLSDQQRVAQFDGPLIEQVLVNLLENAIQYSPPDSPIDVRVEDRDDNLYLAVADRGEGVRPEDRDRIFEKFRQARDGAEKGTGLGLTICQAIVEAHGGSIRVDERRAGEGAIFEVLLPQPRTRPDEPPAVDEARSSCEGTNT